MTQASQLSIRKPAIRPKSARLVFAAVKSDLFDLVNVFVRQSIVDSHCKAKGLGLALVVNCDSHPLSIGNSNRIALYWPKRSIFVDRVNCVLHSSDSPG
jgi:hypothetical protein